MTRPSKFYDSYDDCNFPNKIIEREREKNFIKSVIIRYRNNAL